MEGALWAAGLVCGDGECLPRVVKCGSEKPRHLSGNDSGRELEETRRGVAGKAGNPPSSASPNNVTWLPTRTLYSVDPLEPDIWPVGRLFVRVGRRGAFSVHSIANWRGSSVEFLFSPLLGLVAAVLLPLYAATDRTASHLVLLRTMKGWGELGEGGEGRRVGVEVAEASPGISRNVWLRRLPLSP